MLLKKSKLFSIVVCIITVLSMLSLMIPNNAGADSNDKSITLVCISDKVVLSGMKWKLYKVGVRTNNNRNFSQTGDFAGIQVNLRKLTEDRVNEAAQTFQAYAIANQLPPLREGETNEYGEVVFSGLDAGLYLVTGKLLKTDSHYYVPTTALIEVKEDDDNLRYDAYPKFEYQVMNAQPRRYTVKKIWTGDEEHLDGRPTSVTIAIYRDEEYCESVVLNDENEWQYNWIDYEGASAWIAMEKDVPPHYELNIKYDSERYRIENIYTDEVFTNTIPSGSKTTSTTTTTTTTTQTNDSITKTTTATTGSGNVNNDSGTRTTTATTTGSGNINNGSGTKTTTVTTTGSGNANDGSVTRTTTSGSVADQSVTATRTTSTTDVSQADGSVTRTRETSTSQNNDKVTTTSSNGGGNGGGSGGGGNGNGSGSGSGKLPQTGQLWWPIVPLSIGGVLLVAAGLVIKARKKSDD